MLIHEMTHEQKRLDFISGLRQLAQVFESNPDMPIPGWSQEITIWPDKLEDSKADAKKLLEVLGGTEKKYDNLFELSWNFGQMLKLRFLTYRENICERVVVGKKVIPAQEERVIPATEEYVEDIVEWKCSSILASSTSKD
jgi:hypothetical protein